MYKQLPLFTTRWKNHPQHSTLYVRYWTGKYELLASLGYNSAKQTISSLKKYVLWSVGYGKQ